MNTSPHYMTKGDVAVSLKWIARDLYRLHRKVEELENAIGNASGERAEALMVQLRKTKAERDRLRNALEAKKERPKTRARF